MKPLFAAAATLMLATAAMADADKGNEAYGPAPDRYTVLGASFSLVSSGTEGDPHYTETALVSSLLRSEFTGNVVQCHFAATYAGDEAVKQRGYKTSTVYIAEAGEGALTVADALRPSRDENRAEMGSCFPYETPLTSAQMQGRDLPVTPIRFGAGGTDKQAMSATANIFSDPVREKRLQSQYWYEKLNEKPDSPLLLVRDKGKDASYRVRGSGCLHAGDFTVALAINDAHINNRSVTSIPLRTNCPELR